MPKIYDIEAMLDDVKTLLLDHLNDRITAVAAEKGDGLLLKPVADDAYFLQTLDERVTNFDPFILYGIDEPTVLDGIPGVTLERQVINVVLCAAENGQDLELARRMLRYSRAIREVFEQFWAENQNGVRLSIQGLAPIQFSLLNSSQDFRAVGVSIQAEMA